MKKSLFLLCVSALCLSSQAQAALVSVSGGNGQIIPAVSIQEDTPTNTHQQGFNEKQSVVLANDITVDAGTIAAGTTVDSHIIFLNTLHNLWMKDKNTWEFDGEVLGVMSNKSGSLLKATNDIFAAFDDYFTVGKTLTFNAAGLEQNNINGNNDGYLAYGAMLDLQMVVTEPGDWIRVITASNLSAVPVPAAAFLFAPALLGLMGLRRKAKNVTA